MLWRRRRPLDPRRVFGAMPDEEIPPVVIICATCGRTVDDATEWDAADPCADCVARWQWQSRQRA